MAISDEQYKSLQDLYDIMNREFFEGKLPEVLLLLDFHTRHAAGYFAYEKFKSAENLDKRISGLGLNPDTFTRTIEYVADTLLHEMCHCWECEKAHKAPKDGYHTNVWCDRMRENGLEPVFNNKSRTRVSDTPIEGGKYQTFIRSLENRDRILKVMTDAKGASKEEGEEGTQEKKGSKIKYTCTCGNNVWGKAGLHIHCPVCDEDFEESN